MTLGRVIEIVPVCGKIERVLISTGVVNVLYIMCYVRDVADYASYLTEYAPLLLSNRKKGIRLESRKNEQRFSGHPTDFTQSEMKFGPEEKVTEFMGQFYTTRETPI